MRRGALFLLAILELSPVQSQSAIATRRDTLIQSYRLCVLTTSLGMPGEKHMVAEQAFFACSTEEQALRAWFAIGPVDPNLANAFVVRLKADMKRTILGDPTTN